MAVYNCPCGTTISGPAPLAIKAYRKHQKKYHGK